MRVPFFVQGNGMHMHASCHTSRFGEKRMNQRLYTLLCVLLLFASSVQAQEARNEQVHFPRGTDSTAIQQSITGYQSVNYRLHAQTGQSMTVELTSDNSANYFNIYTPGKGPGDEAMFIGTLKGRHYAGTLPAAGEYTIQVFLMRSAARRHEKARYTLNIEIR